MRYPPQATKAEGSGVLRRTGARARRSGAGEYRLSHTAPTGYGWAAVEKRRLVLRDPARTASANRCADKVEVVGLAAPRQGLRDGCISRPASRSLSSLASVGGFALGFRAGGFLFVSSPLHADKVGDGTVSGSPYALGVDG